MNDVRVPGFLWAVAIVMAVALIHTYEAQIQAATGLDAYVLDLAVTALIGVLKGLNLGTGQLDQALDIIDSIIGRSRVRVETVEPGAVPMRGGMSPVVTLTEASLPSAPPPRPNKVARWLVG